MSANPRPLNPAALPLHIFSGPSAPAAGGLDFTPGSLQRLDDVLEEFFPPDFPPLPITVVLLGAYLGEAVIRNLGGGWRQEGGPDNWCVAGIAGRIQAFPIRRMASRLAEGVEASLAFWYETLRKGASR